MLKNDEAVRKRYIDRPFGEIDRATEDLSVEALGTLNVI
jgi:hypothetical protein